MPTIPAAHYLRFGDLLRRFRVERGLTQELLAERTGLSVRGISDLERGARNLPRQETILRLIDGLELPVDEQALLLAVSQRAPRPRALPLDTRRLNFPGDLSRHPDAFIGRDAELTAIMLALHDPSHRLLTLTGPPGVGKTRLALEAVQRLDALIPIEVTFVDLAPIRSPPLVLPAIAAAVGLPESGSELLDRLKARLVAHPSLLLLDNFEHLLEATPDVSELLQERGSVRLLVTSREPLRVDGEQELPVSPLATPRLASEMQVRDVVAHEAVALFVVRARESDRAFRLTDENARPIAELCVRLDGLPLALELAAARVPHLSPAAIVERLAQRRPVLTAGRHNLPERQRTLADAIDWSYELLATDEQRLFRLCSLFLGGFTVDAVEAIGYQRSAISSSSTSRLSPSPITHHPSPASHLASLADKSLLVRQPGELRFGMLETIREYGLERLVASGEEAAVREAHAAYFLAFAEDAAREFRSGEGQRAANARLVDEHDNLRQALVWALEQTDPTPLLRLTEALWRFWWIQAHASEGQRWLELALARGQDAPPAARAKSLIAAGRLAWMRHDLARATQWLDAALALRSEPFDHCEGLNALADVAHFQQAYERAEAALTEAIALARAHEDWFHLSASLHNLGIVALDQGDYARARSALDEGVTWARRAGQQYLLGSALHHLSRTAFETGDYAQAAALWRETLALQRELAPTHPIGAVTALEGVALLAIVQDRYALAARLLGTMAAQRMRVEDREHAKRRRDLAPWIATARQALGDERFTSEWEAGYSLPIEEALAEAAALLDVPTHLRSGKVRNDLRDE